MKKRSLIKVFFYLAVFLVCSALLGIDFFHHRHSDFAREAWPGFYPLVGFLSLWGVVLVARFLVRPILLKKEDYYD